MKTSAHVHYVLAHVLLAGVVIQFLLAGLGIFGAISLVPHFILGDLLVLIALIALIVALVSRRARGWTAVLFIALIAQRLLPLLDGSAPAVAGLHVLNAGFLLFAAAAVFRGAPPSLKAIERSGATAPAATQAPQPAPTARA